MDLGIWHAGLTIAVTGGVFLTLLLRRGIATDFLFLAGLAIVTLAGVISPEQALAGFANPAILTIGGLLGVAAGLRITGVLDWIGRRLLGRARSERGAMLRLAPTVTAASAFLLNTAVVAMMMPVVLDWCRRHSVSPSRLLLPLSYMAIFGGVCTTLGTSTTLVVQGKLSEIQRSFAEQAKTDASSPAITHGNAERARRRSFERDLRPLAFFEIGGIGLPCAVMGALLLLLFGPRLLPNRLDLVEQFGENRREYLVEMLVLPRCPMIGQTVEAAGLRQLPGLFLIEIDREGEILTPVTPQDIIHQGDRLAFTGVVSTIVDLEKTPGFVPAVDDGYESQSTGRGRRHLSEVVLSRTSPLIGQTIRDGQFRQRYNAAVIAVHRNGVRLTNKIGDIELEPGDTLLLQTRTEFVSTYRNHRDFYLVSSVDGVEPRLHNKAPLAAALAGLLLVWLVAASLGGPRPEVGDAAIPDSTLSVANLLARSSASLASPAIAALCIVLLMIVSRCLTVAEARHSLDLSMLLTIGAALGLARALTVSGAAEHVANGLVELVGGRPMLLLAIVFLLAVFLTETITNNAVAAMLLPLAVAVAWQAGLSPRPFIIAITLAASFSFLTPVGYQTNLMVMGPGGYRPLDYLRCGAPLTLLAFAAAMLLIPWFWPF